MRHPNICTNLRSRTWVLIKENFRSWCKARRYFRTVHRYKVTLLEAPRHICAHSHSTSVFTSRTRCFWPAVYMEINKTRDSPKCKHEHYSPLCPHNYKRRGQQTKCSGEIHLIIIRLKQGLAPLIAWRFTKEHASLEDCFLFIDAVNIVFIAVGIKFIMGNFLILSLGL